MRIKISELKKVLKENVELSVLETIETKLTSYKTEIEDILKNKDYSLKRIYTIYKDLNDTLDGIEKKLFDEANLLSNITMDKIYSLNDINNKLNNLSVTITLLVGKLQKALLDRNKNFKTNSVNNSKMEVENNITKLFDKINKDKILPLSKKITLTTSKLINFHKDITTK